MRLWRFAQGDAHLAQDLPSARTSPVRESIGSPTPRSHVAQEFYGRPRLCHRSRGRGGGFPRR